MHAETYGILIQELVADLQEQDRMFGALSTMPSVRAKADWCLRWIESENVDFGIRLVAFAIVEGVFFSSSFAAIFWIRSRGLLPGLCMSNELIARDEGMHTSFACLLYSMLSQRVAVEEVYEMVGEAVDLECAFFDCKRTLAPSNSSLILNFADPLLRCSSTASCWHEQLPHG